MNSQELDYSINSALKAARNNSGELILITGGPTCEDIDAVRFITNRSTGRMGIECAYAAREKGLSPILVLGPTSLQITDSSIPVVNIRSAQDLFYAVDSLFSEVEYLIMSAAVADFTPAVESNVKLKKADIEDINHEFILRLKRTADILKHLKDRTDRDKKLIAGFSLDIEINMAEGLRKLKEKNLDLILINSTAAFAENQSSGVIITRDNQKIELNNLNKRCSAYKIIEQFFRLK